MTKSPRYFFDQEAVREKYVDVGFDPRGFRINSERYTNQTDAQSNHTKTAARGPDGRRATRVVGADGSIQHRDGERWPNGGRNLRSVWEIATQPYPEAHFATFPEALPERCIKAGTSERGCCPECGAAWVRETSTEYDAKGRTTNGPRSTERRHETAGFGQRLEKSVTTMGWLPQCICHPRPTVMDPAVDHGIPVVPCTVLDPFMGSGTTALVARKLGRKSIGIELSQSYAELCAKRLGQQSLFAGDAA